MNKLQKAKEEKRPATLDLTKENYAEVIEFLYDQAVEHENPDVVITATYLSEDWTVSVQVFFQNCANAHEFMDYSLRNALKHHMNITLIVTGL